MLEIMLEFNLNNNIWTKNIYFIVNIDLEIKPKKNVGLRIYPKPTFS